MLILTRKPGESLYIGDVKVTIVELKGHQIRIGIDAPPEIRIYREEIYLQILEENRKAAETAQVPEGALPTLAFSWSGGVKAGDDEGESGKKQGKGSALSGGSLSGGKLPSSSLEKGGSPQVVIRKKKRNGDER